MRRLTVEILAGERAELTRETWADPSQEFCNSFSRLYVIEEGEARIRTGKAWRILKPGFVYMIPAGCGASYVCPKRMILSWMHLRVEAIPLMDVFSRAETHERLLSRKAKDGRHQFPGVPLTEELRHQVNELLDCLNQPASPVVTFRKTALACSLLNPFLPASWDALMPDADTGHRLRPALALMQHAMDRSVSLDELAGTVHLHPTYFSNLFKKTFGVSPGAYHMELRLHRAKMLLVDTALPVARVAAECGFSDEFNFSKTFKRRVGSSPRDFRREGGSVMFP
ncbi:MAG: AraC family transcriptional regulator [Lentisphaeria bacterium]|nr:AraC family transcriptional regulator [Lentisphaeria bacterium]